MRSKRLSEHVVLVKKPDSVRVKPSGIGFDKTSEYCIMYIRKPLVNVCLLSTEDISDPSSIAPLIDANGNLIDGGLFSIFDHFIDTVNKLMFTYNIKWFTEDRYPTSVMPVEYRNHLTTVIQMKPIRINMFPVVHNGRVQFATRHLTCSYNGSLDCYFGDASSVIEYSYVGNQTGWEAKTDKFTIMSYDETKEFISNYLRAFKDYEAAHTRHFAEPLLTLKDKIASLTADDLTKLGKYFIGAANHADAVRHLSSVIDSIKK